VDFFWNVYQDSKIAEARASASSARAKIGDVATYVRHIEERLDKLALVCRAMWSFLREATELTDQDLIERVKEIDLSDGKLDGKVRKPIAKCPKCGRVMSSRHSRCIWCGAERSSADAFDQV